MQAEESCINLCRCRHSDCNKFKSWKAILKILCSWNYWKKGKWNFLLLFSSRLRSIWWFCVLKCLVQYFSILTQKKIRLQSSSGDRIHNITVIFCIKKGKQLYCGWLPWKNYCLLFFIIISITVEPWYNEPLYNGVLGITNDFLDSSNSKLYEKVPRYNETSYLVLT